MSDLRRHFADHFDGTLSEEARHELCTYIKADPKHAQEFIAAAFIHSRLREKFRGWNNSDSGLHDAHVLPAITDQDLSETITGADVFAQAAMNADRIIESPRRIRPLAFKRALPIAAGLLVALITIGLWYWAAHRPVATIARLVNVQWNGNSFLQGARVRGDIQLKSGFAEVALDSGASVLLEGPALARIDSGSKIELLYGKLTTNVPPAAIGFTVNTGRTSIVDLGTEVGIDATHDHPLHVEVFKGKAAVQIADAQGQESERKVLTQSMAVAVSNDGHLHDVSPTPLAFARTDDIAKPAPDGHAFTDRLLRDPSIIAYYPFDNSVDAPNRLLNRAPATPEKYPGEIVGPRWDAGRSPTRSAVHFQSESDHVSINIPGRNAALTVAQWVHFDGPQQSHADLLMGTRNPVSDTFHWQLISRASLGMRMYLITQLPSPSSASTEHAFPLNFDLADNRWHLLAFTFDGDAHTLRAYCDGRLIGSVQQNDLSDLTIGNADIGNFKPMGHSYSEVLHGRIDEMVIWNRAVSEEELAAMHAAGTPN